LDTTVIGVVEMTSIVFSSAGKTRLFESFFWILGCSVQKRRTENYDRGITSYIYTMTMKNVMLSRQRDVSKL